MDCISREAAIKCLECDFDITGKSNMEVVVDYINSAHDKILNLPSVKQESKTVIIDKIRAEIQENINYNKKMNYHGIVAGLLLTLDIIDKYIHEDNEDDTCG